MKITVITGTDQKGCTYRIKEIFLNALGTGHEFTQYYLPCDLPDFCCCCKVTFHKKARINSFLPLILNSCLHNIEQMHLLDQAGG